MSHILQFIHDTAYANLPSEVQEEAAFCLLDLIGSLCAGRQTRLSAIIRDHAFEVFAGDQATILLDGRRCSPPGAALANGMTIDSLDIHDSHRESLGHAGVHVFPSSLAAAEHLQATSGAQVSGREFLSALAVGYEVAVRAGVALHATVSDYHTSGAWGAVSSAAIFSRLHSLSTDQTRHALGIAEYHGPRSQMMRVIDSPTMLKDGSGWGAMAGLSAGMLAAQGFTGAPAVTVEGDDVAHIWQDLGSRWLILEQGFKVHGVCWWAQPAIEAALALVGEHNLTVSEIQRVDVETFEKATRLAHPRPSSSEEAQYSLPYPVAAALWAWADGGQAWPGIGPRQLLEDRLEDERVLALAERVYLREARDLTAQFPRRFLARVTITTSQGNIYRSGETTFRGEEEFPLSQRELRQKYRWLASDLLAPSRVAAVERVVDELPGQPAIVDLLACLSAPPHAVK